MKRSRLSIELKLNLIIFAATAVALAVASSALVFSAAQNARRQTETDLSTLAKIIGNNSKAALLFDDSSDGENILSALAGKSVVAAAQLYDAQNRPFALFRREGADLDIPPQAPPPAEPRTRHGHLWVASRIEQDGQTIGTVLVAETLAPLQSAIRRQILLSALVTAASALLAMYLASRLLHIVLKHIRRVVDVAQAIARGELPEPLPVAASDEIGELQTAFNQIVEATRNVVRQTQTVASGDYSISIQPRSGQDALAHALIEMTAKLKVFHEGGIHQSRLKSGLSDLNDRMRGEPDLDTLLRNILTVVVAHTGALAGAIYLVRGPNHIEMAAGYAVDPADAPDKREKGLVAQVAAERRFRKVSCAPEDGFPLRTGFLECTLREIAVAPLAHDEMLAGVLEIASFDGFDDVHREFLEQASSSIAIAIQSAQSRARLDELLAETQRQSFALQDQQIALKRSNQDLEERNLLLERQKQEIHRQKDALESAQLDLERKARELEMASKYKSEFLANMSHELRTPLNSMLILSRLLAENKPGNLNPKQIEFSQTIHKAGSDLLTLINDILDLSKVEAGRLEFHFEKTVVASLGDSLRAIFNPLAKEKGIGFSVDVLPGVPETILTDPQRLGQILRNLLGNAFKFTAKGGVALRIHPPADDEAAIPGAAVSFAVEDSGIGIPADKQALIFHAFQQADGTTSRKYGGTGLGLSISRELAQRMGGDIRLRSVVDQGSTFTLVMPLAPPPRRVDPAAAATPPASAAPAAPAPAPAPPPPSPAAPPPPADAPANARTLLVVDDDPSFSRIVADFARERGFQVLCAADGHEGLNLAATHRPYGILLDMMLPGLDGNAVIQKLKDSDATRTIPVFVLSALDHDQQMLRLGSVGFLTKPVSPQDLDLVLRRFEWVRSRKEKTLLVVDDEPHEAQAVAELLDGWPVHVLACTTGAEALALCKTADVDAVLLDWGLDDMSGRDVVEAIVPSNPAAYVPVVLYTGRDLVREEEAAVRRKVVSVVVKGKHAPDRLLAKLAFYLHLVPPAPTPSRSPAPRPRAAASPENAHAGARILIVDDDMRNLYSLSSVLESMGAAPLAAPDGQKALDLLEQDPSIQLVLMDIMMPVMDGFQAIREIRRRESIRHVPVIALTAKAMKEDREACLAAGANDYVPKPVDVDQLVLAAKSWIRK